MFNLPQLPALVNDNPAKSEEMTLKMDITYLLQIIATILINLVVLPPVIRLADWYARLIKDRPFERTWLSVLFGVGFSEIAIFILVEVTFIIFGIFAQAWWIPPLYIIIIYVITGTCQAYRQEQKRLENKKKSKELNDLDDIVKWQDKN